MEKIKSDRELILKFLNREYKDDHPAIYLYACGQHRSQTTAIFNVIKYSKIIFYPCFSDYFLHTIIEEFLEFKKCQYNNGEIIVKPIY